MTDPALCYPDEARALDAANARYRDDPRQLVVLTLDESHAVSEVRYVRRDAAGRFTALERRRGLAEILDLTPHPEGGWYRETWVSPVSIVPEGYDGARASATAIYFLLPPGTESCWHVVRSDELWLWQRGDPLTLKLGGTGDRPASEPPVTLGPDVESGQVLQALVPGGTWQSARPAGDREALVSCIVSPGFSFADFRTIQD